MYTTLINRYEKRIIFSCTFHLSNSSDSYCSCVTTIVTQLPSGSITVTFLLPPKTQNKPKNITSNSQMSTIYIQPTRTRWIGTNQLRHHGLLRVASSRFRFRLLSHHRLMQFRHTFTHLHHLILLHL